MSSVTVQTVTLHAERLGTPGKLPLVAIHGWGHNLSFLKPLMELLASDADIHLIDLPGFGSSPAPDAVWGVKEYAQSVLHYLDTNSITSATFVGHSFGGKTSLYIAAHFPERVDRLVLINSSGLKPIRPLKRQALLFGLRIMRNVLKFIDRRFYTKIYESWYIPRFASPDYKSAGSLRQTFVKVVNEDLTQDIANISVPALLLWGSADTETPLAMGKKLHSLLKHAQFVELSGKDHLPFIGPGASLCAYHIRQFLNNPSPLAADYV